MSSPRKIKRTGDAALGGNLNDGRAALVEDVGPIALKLTVDDYFKSILPPLKPVLEERFDAAWDALCLSNAYDRVSLGWTAFQSLPELNENGTYQALVEIAEQVVNASVCARNGPLQALQQTFEFTQDPDRFPNSFLRHSEHKPDGYFVSCNGDSTKKANWMDIGPTGEYKKADTPKARLDNNEKMLWSMQHTMREDPRRRHAHAFTIEKTTMRLWYSDRVDTVVSEAFDFMMEPERLLRFFFAFLYADEADVGWDPTVTCVWEDGSEKPQYLIDVQDDSTTRTHKTLELVSSIGAEALHGRGTRVWRVVRYDRCTATVVDPQTEYILKDCWVDDTLEREGAILDEILATAEKMAQPPRARKGKARAAPQPFLSPEDLSLLKQSLLAYDMHGVVRLPTNDAADRTLDRKAIFPSDTPLHYIFEDTAMTKKKQAAMDRRQAELKGEWRNVQEARKLPQNIRLYNQKAHYRIVFRDVCEPLKDQRFLDEILRYLAMALQALEVLHKVGWVHRDISIGNVLVARSEDGPVVKLADLEYAKALDQPASKSQELRTGTANFMAVEVATTSYLFLPKTVKYSKASERVNLHARNVKPTARNMQQAPKLLWSYNPLHDLESLWWMAKYFLDNKDIVFISRAGDESVWGGQSPDIPQETLYARAARLADQYRYAHTLFHHPAEGRFGALVAGQESSFVHPCLMNGGIPESLENIRLALHGRYREVEQNITEDGAPIDAGDRLYRTIEEDLVTAMSYVESLPVLLQVQDLAPVAIKSGEESMPTTTGDLLASAMERMNIAPPGAAQEAATQVADPPVPAPALVETRKPRTKSLPLPTDRRLRSAN